LSKVSKIADLTPFSRGVNVLAKVIEKAPERTVLSKFDRTEHKIVEATIADETGAITLVLWDDNIDKINEGDTIELENAFVKVFKRSMQLNIGRYGTLKVSEKEMKEVNTKNNLSEKEVERRPFRTGFSREKGRGMPRK
jgi:replication factor A1